MRDQSNKGPRRSERERLLVKLLRDCLETGQLSLDEYRKEKYLKEVLERIAGSFNLPYSILRYETPGARERFQVLTSCGVPSPAEIEWCTDVQREKRLVEYLGREKYCYIRDTKDEKAPNDQRALHLRLGLRSALACRIRQESRLVGFFIFLRKEVDAFTPVEIDFITSDLMRVLKRLFEFSLQFGWSSNQYHVLREAFDPEKLSLENFRLEKYLSNVLKTVGKRFDVPFIILRRENPADEAKLEVAASYGLPSAVEIQKWTRVTKKRSLVKILMNTGRYLYMEDLFAEDCPFEETKFAKDFGLLSALACPIIIRDRFIGFIIYFKDVEDGFKSMEIKFLWNRLNGIIERVFLFAESYTLYSVIGQLKAHLRILGHDFPKFFSSPTISAVDRIDELIQNNRKDHDVTPAEKVLHEVSIEICRIRTLAVHYNAIFQLFLQSTDFSGYEARFLQDEFTVFQCYEEIETVFRVLQRAKEVTAVTSQPFEPFVKFIKLDCSAKDLESMQFRGNKSLLVEFILNLLANSLESITDRPDDSSRNPILLDRDRGLIRLTTSLCCREGAEFLKVTVNDEGIGIDARVYAEIQEMLVDAERAYLSGDISEQGIFRKGPSTKHEHLGAGIRIVLENLVLLGISYGAFITPEVKSQVNKGTKFTLYYPIEKIGGHKPCTQDGVSAE